MSMQMKVKKIRAKSARMVSEDKKYLIQNDKKINQRNQLLQKVYSKIPTFHQRPTSANKKIIKGKTLLNTDHLQYYQIQDKKKQAIIEQNINLKKRNQILQEQLLFKNKQIQAASSKKCKKYDELKIKFDNQNLWNGNNSYMITGIKNQYQILKNKYKEKCYQYDIYRNEFNSTMYLEIKKQSEILKKQNIKLIQNLIKDQQRIKSIYNTKISNFNASQLEIIISELQFKNKQIEKKLTEANKKNKQTLAIFKQQQKKVKFLEKLIIQKDNSLHALNKKVKNLEKINQLNVQQINNFKNQNKNIKDNYQNRLEKLETIEERKRYEERETFNKALATKNKQIQKLEKQIAYMTTLMSYWKPLDQENRRQKLSQEDLQITSKIKNDQQMIKRLQQSQKIHTNPSLNLAKMTTGSMLQHIKHQPLTHIIVQKPATHRQQKRADKKRSQYAQKTRAVKIHQVQQIGQILRFRMIAQRISHSGLKQFFNYVSNPKLSKQENQWKTEYINMKQCIQLFSKKPFNLTPVQSKLLSQYIVQDVVQDYVYRDLQNQNKRRIVVSILKNLMGDYQLTKSLQQISLQAQIELNKYRSKLLTILQQMYPGGLISKKKIIQIFIGSGFQIRQDIMQFIIGKIIIQSQNLNNLQYSILF